MDAKYAQGCGSFLVRYVRRPGVMDESKKFYGQFAKYDAVI